MATKKPTTAKKKVVKTQPKKPSGNPNPPNQWKKGQSGNPKGRPSKGYSIAEMMKEMYGSNPEKKEELIKAMHIKAATMGDVQAFKAIISYLDGLPTAHEDLSEQENALNNHFQELANVLNKVRPSRKKTG